MLVLNPASDADSRKSNSARNLVVRSQCPEGLVQVARVVAIVDHNACPIDSDSRQTQV